MIFEEWLEHEFPPGLYYKLDENENPVSLKTGKELLEYLENRDHWHLTDYIDEIYISTSFLWLNSSFLEHPLLWETMIFGGKHNMYQKRYGSAEEARKGHTKAIKLVKESIHAY